MAAFSPIAIIGRGCVLPGAFTPEALHAVVAEGRTLIRPVPEGRWRADRARILSSEWRAALTDRGAFVEGFEALFDPARFRLPAEELDRADRLVQWLLHAGLAALAEAGLTPGSPILERAGAVVGNLSFANEALTRMAEAHWLGRPCPIPAAARFNSGLPAHLLCQGLGLGAGGFALDAACASSLYAIHLACRRLQTGAADLMMAGAVNAVDLLQLHSGFTALGALSPTGQSRPFNAEADGLLPAEGAALVLLRRLDDAVAAGDRILGVIRGIGLSNDGRTGGFLAPSARGQERAMRQAYELSGIAPRDIGLIECHATGTQLGDATEIASTAAVFQGCADVAIGSLKANLGHAITVAGAAGLLKVLGCLESGLIPTTPNAHPTAHALDGTPLRVPTTNEPWPSGRRCAAISGFGFGGTNAHMIVEAWEPARHSAPARQASPQQDIAVVAVGAHVGSGRSLADFVRATYTGEPDGCAASVHLPMAGLRFPPKDLRQAHGQQTMLLTAAFEAIGSVKALPLSRTGVIVGIQCDPEVCHMPFRLRLPELAPDLAPPPSRDPLFVASDVIGFMPNIPANRINSQFDFGGPSFSVAAEELSGLRALEVACDMLTSGALDAAIVGAADLSDEPIHRAALAQLGRGDDRAGDAAVVLILKRLADAERDGDRVLAVVEADGDTGPALDWRPYGQTMRRTFGVAHAASVLVDVAAAVVALHRSALPPGAGDAPCPWLPDRAPRRIAITADALGGQSGAVTLREGQRSTELSPTRSGWMPGPALDVVVFGGATLDELRQALMADTPLPPPVLAGRAAPGARLAIVRSGGAIAPGLHAAALDAIDRAERGVPAAALPPDITFQPRPLTGDLAFVFTGSAAAYPGMGRELLTALPGLVDSVQRKFAALRAAASWVYDGSTARPGDYQQLCGSSLLCQAHAALTLDVLGLQPRAALGISSGETNALYALGAWHDISGLLDDITEAHLYDRVLSGEYEAVKEYWRNHGIAAEPWESWTLWAPIDAVKAATRGTAARVAIVYAPEECLLAGPASACAQVIDAIGPDRALRLNIQLACHVPAAEPAAGLWRRLHSRPTTPPEAVRFYANAIGDSYVPTEAAIADMLTRQSVDTVDFPRTVRKAHADGVRIFVEHGPRAMCSGWIRAILGEKEHLAVSLDAFGRSSLRQTLQAAAQLAAAGVPLRLDELASALGAAEARPSAHEDGKELVLPAHRPPVLQRGGATKADILPAPPTLRAPRWVAAVFEEEPVLAVARDHPVEVVSRLHASLSHAHQAYLDRTLRLQTAFFALMPGGHDGGAWPAAAEAAADVGTPAHAEPARPTTALSRTDLEALASGPLSAVWGERFAPLDHVKPLVRMPQPPLLLADRVTAIDAPQGILGIGSITTETEIKPDDWFLQHGRMPAGLTIEAGQADLLLISWMGIDFHNHGQRVYRLLGCDLVYHGNLPKVGDRLRYRITIDDHSALGDTRLFFFQSDGTANGAPMLTVRHGQAGFFSAEELASAEGVLWEPAAPPTPDGTAKVSPLPRVTQRRRLTRDDLAALAEGRVADCFGPEFNLTRSHTRTPTIPGARMMMLQDVPELAPQGGPWGRGYLRATWTFDPGDWFFAGHFLDDPCMPGTLMFEGCLQAMAILMMSMGLTVGRDGWRFEPVPEEPYRLRCRGQATPANTLLTYEVFVDEVIDGPTPTLYADILGTVDGLKAFHCRRMGLRLIQDWPFETVSSEVTNDAARPCALNGGFRLDHRSLLACAVGRPSDAFGPAFAPIEDGRSMPRLPAPPYHFITRVIDVDAPFLGMRDGSSATLEYDVPPDAWYFAEPGGAMPFAVLFEAALQPCGWLGSYVGIPLSSRHALHCRNLEGTARIHATVRPDAQRLTVTTRLTSIADAGGVVLIACRVTMVRGDEPVMELDTKFGFFPAAALAQQVGLPIAAADRAAHDAPPHAAFLVRGAPWGAWIAGERLLMIDRVTGWWPDGGAARLGLIRGEAKVDPGTWSFKAHFFSDPVQPGSLGVEAMLQLLKLDLLRRGLARGSARPVFDPILEGESIEWKYRGQVRPHNGTVVTIVEIIERRDEGNGVVSRGRASTWVDGIRIYEATLAVRLQPPPPMAGATRERILDPGLDLWLGDHCPTLVIPAMPWMATVDLVMNAAATAANRATLCARDIRALGWLAFPQGPQRLRTRADGSGAVLEVWRALANPVFSRFEPVAKAQLVADDEDIAPRPMPALSGAALVHDPERGLDLYEQGHLFHGPRLRVLRQLMRSDRGADGLLQLPPDAPADEEARRWILMDGVTHCIPGEALHLWSPDIPQDAVGYPNRARDLRWTAVTVKPGQSVRAQVRFAGMTADRTPSFAIRLALLDDGVETPWVEGYLDYLIFRKGGLGELSREELAHFLVDRRPHPRGRLAEIDPVRGQSTLSVATLAGADWLPGTIARVYGCEGLTGLDLAVAVAVKDHMATLLDVHPATVAWQPERALAQCGAAQYHFDVTRAPDRVTVSARALASALIGADA